MRSLSVCVQSSINFAGLPADWSVEVARGEDSTVHTLHEKGSRRGARGDAHNPRAPTRDRPSVREM